ncbi:hypothetical protein HYC85_023878 [Camellia sinensis]|uniref:NADP-dependent oxidoreductase domain-containing protein n=1 Tax=Camellia sinensis TaxID=4442 RepID=A0A7J7GFR8_CAMSI|nr:hypothetical protein HYC85_023878 [Camellia sinensis]
MAVIPEITLGSSGKTMPVIGMGTGCYPPVGPEATTSAILEAIRVGYRHFDTAFIYGSEQPLGVAVAEALRLGLVKSRDEFHITTKLWCSFAHRDKVVSGIKTSLKTLQLEYVDLYLIHWPLTFTQDVSQAPVPKEYIVPFDTKSVWEGMEECLNLGLAKAIGVSNFSSKKLEEVLAIAKIPPAVNQVEMNPLWKQKKLREFCKEKGIHITAYSPLGANGTMWGDNRIVDCDVLSEIAKARGKTTAQVSLRWVYEQGVSLVAKSFNKERMKENLEIFDWSLTEEESKIINELPERKGVQLASFVGTHDIVKELEAEIS